LRWPHRARGARAGAEIRVAKLRVTRAIEIDERRGAMEAIVDATNSLITPLLRE